MRFFYQDVANLYQDFFCIFSDVIIVLFFFSDFIIYELRGFNEEKLWRKMFMDDDEFKKVLIPYLPADFKILFFCRLKKRRSVLEGS